LLTEICYTGRHTHAGPSLYIIKLSATLQLAADNKTSFQSKADHPHVFNYICMTFAFDLLRYSDDVPAYQK